MSKFGNVFVKSSDTGNSQLVSNINAIRVKANTITGESMILNQGIDVDNATIRGGVKIEGETEVNKRIYQELNPDASWNAVNGYYGLAKDAYPAVSETTSKKALSNWTVRTGNIVRFTSITWSSVYGFVGVGDPISGEAVRIASSIDGINWTFIDYSNNFNFDDSSANGNIRLNSVVWSKELNMFVAVGKTNRTRCIYSKDGNSNWLHGNSGVILSNCNTGLAIDEITCDSTNGLFIGQDLVKLFGTGSIPTTTRIIEIIDEFTFKTNTTITDLSNSTLKADFDWRSIIWAKELGLFVAYGINYSIMTSSDGINWITRNGGITGILTTLNLSSTQLIWSPELSLFIGTHPSSGNLLISYNGIDWTIKNIPILQNINIISITWSSNLNMFLITSFNSSINKIFYSYDGFNWEDKIISLSANKTSVRWIKELKIFLITTDVSNSYFISSNGFEWENISSLPAGNVGAFAYSPELSIALIGTYYGSPLFYKILTAQLNARLPTSYNVFDSSFNNIDNNGNWTIRAKEIYNPGNLLLDVKGNLDLSGNISSPTSGAFSNLYLQFNMNGNTYKIPLNFN
jgi:hypothetical protein